MFWSGFTTGILAFILMSVTMCSPTVMGQIDDINDYCQKRMERPRAQ